MIKSLYEIPPGCICQGDGLLGMRCAAPKHATKIDRAEVAAAQFRVTARDVMEKLDQVKGLRAGLEGA